MFGECEGSSSSAPDGKDELIDLDPTLSRRDQKTREREQAGGFSDAIRATETAEEQ
jgi:hypothetical protein